MPTSGVGAVAVTVRVDVVGWYSVGDPSDPEGSGFVAVDPEVVFESWVFASSSPERIEVTGGVPSPEEVTAVALSVTVGGSTADGVATVASVDSGGVAGPAGEVVSYSAGQLASNTVVVERSGAGGIELVTSGAGTAFVHVDVIGYWYGARRTTTYTYGAVGMRRSRENNTGFTEFGWDHASGLPMLLSETTAGAATRYLYGPGGLPLAQYNPDGSRWYLHGDQLGSTRAVTDTTGAVIATYTYDAWGRVTATTGNPAATRLRYAGQYTDPETGYQYLRARYYDPTTGQFLSRDPLNAMTRSPYGYVYGDPLNRVDPSGLAPWDGTCIRGVNCPVETQSLGESWGQSFREDHPEVAQGIVDYSSGVLAVNPITTATNATGLTDTGQKANTCSGWYTAGVVSMLLVDFAAGPSIGQGGGVVTHWGAESPWVMNGGKSWWNFIKSGMPGRAAYSSGVEASAEGLKLSWPSGIEWWKGFLGQRIVG